MNKNKINGQHFIDHPAVRPALAKIDVGNGRQAHLYNPASFLITPDNDFSLVSAHTLARLGVVNYEKFHPTSNRIGYFDDPSGRDVLVIGGVKLEVLLRVALNGHLDAHFRGVIGFMVYQEPPEPADRLFSMGRCSLLCCHDWDTLLVPHNPSLPLHVPPPSQQQQHNQQLQQPQQLLQQQQQQQLQVVQQLHLLEPNGNGNIATDIDLSPNANLNPHANAPDNPNAHTNTNSDAPPTLTASASNNHGSASNRTHMHPRKN